MEKPEISVIIPIYNEEKNISLLLDRLYKTIKPLNTSYEFIFINDGSKDSSINLIKELSKNDEHIKFIDLSRNFGHQIAVSAGLDRARGNIIVIIDADLQDPPELIPDLIKVLKQGYEVVYAK